MKNSSNYINEKVFNTNLKYAKLQNQTEELFFQCLDEERDLEYFYKKLDELWGNIDHSFIEDEIQEYANLIEENNLYYLDREKIESERKIPSSILIAAGIFLASEQKYKNTIKTRYSIYYNSPVYKADKDEYLKEKVKTYDNQVIPYFNKYGEVVRYVQLSTYLSMKYNTALTRTAWDRTLEMAELYGYDKFWIPPHSFSCKHCYEYQGKILTENEVSDFTTAEEQEGDILHPNCKCELLIYTPLSKLKKQTYSLE